MSLAIFLCVGEQAFPQVETSVAPPAHIYALKVDVCENQGGWQTLKTESVFQG